MVAWRKHRIDELNTNDLFSKFYTFDDSGMLQFNDNEVGYKGLADLVAKGLNNAPLHTLEE